MKQFKFVLMLSLAILISLILTSCCRINSVRQQLSIAEKRLALAEEKFHVLAHFLNQNIDEGIVFVSMDGRIQEANNKYLDMLGYTLDEAKKLTYQQVTLEKWHDMEDSLRVNQVMVKGFCDIYEKEYIRSDNTTFTISTRAWLVNDEEGNPWRLMGIIKETSMPD